MMCALQLFALQLQAPCQEAPPDGWWRAGRRRDREA
jgi:hypothetical protein